MERVNAGSRKRALRNGIAAVTLSLLIGGCGTVRETLPARAPIEQLLLSTAADRAISQLPADPFKDKVIFLDTTNLQCYDQAYVTQRIREALLRRGAFLAPNRDTAEIVLEVASGGLSIDNSDKLFGLPAIPIPLTFADTAMELPETPLYKVLKYNGTAKLLFSAVDAETNGRSFDIPICYGHSRDRYYWFLLFGPFRTTNLPEDARW